MAMAVASSARLAFLRDAVRACCTLRWMLSLFGPCTAMVQRAPGHNRWGVSETTLPVKTQGRTLDCPFLISVHHVLLQGGLFVSLGPSGLMRASERSP